MSMFTTLFLPPGYDNNVSTMESGVGGGGGGGGAVITDVQRFLYPDQTPYTRYASGTSYLRDVSTTGDYRVPQLGRCCTLNGSSERLSITGHPLSGHTGGFTYAAWVSCRQMVATRC